MVASAFVVSLDPALMARGLRDSVGAVIVWANNSTDAKAMAKGLYGNDANADWDNATVNTMAAAADFTGWTLRARVTKPDGSSKADVSYVGIADDDIDDTADGLVLLLNAVPGIANAAYNSGTNVLTVTGAADTLGDHFISVEFYPPTEPSNKNTGVLVKQGVAVPGFVVSKVDNGAGGDACTAQLAADSYTIPKITGQFKFAG